MAKVKAPHHRGSYQVRAKRVTDLAAMNPNTRCWRCGLTLREHTPHRNGRPPHWTAGHIRDGEVDGALAPEASTCNFSAGATAGNRKRGARRTALTW